MHITRIRRQGRNRQPPNDIVQTCTCLFVINVMNLRTRAQFSTCSKDNTDFAVNTFQSNEVKGSYHMELEGLKRGLAQLAALGLKVKVLVTDMDLQIQKFLREKWSTIRHYYDVWHVAKGR